MIDGTYIEEAFKACSLLTEEDLDISQDFNSLDALDGLLHDDTEEPIEVIDADAEDEEEAESTSHIGDVLLWCTACKTPTFKKPEEVIIDEEDGLANIDEECMYCHSTAGYLLDGQVQQYKPESEVTVEVEDKPESEEGEDEDADDEEEKKEVSEDYSGVTKSCPICKKQYSDYSALSRKDNKTEICPDCGRQEAIDAWKASKNMKEGLEKVELETEDKVIKVSEEEKPETDEEMIAPIDTEVQDEIEAANEDEEEEAPFEDEEDDDLMQLPTENGAEGETVDIDVDEFDEEAFNDLGEAYLRKVYGNVASYEVSKVSNKGNALMVEGVITFESGNKKVTNFVFESNVAKRSGRVKFLGENKQISRGKKSFVLTGRVEDKKFIAESFRYNYKAPLTEGKTTRVYGTVRRTL